MREIVLDTETTGLDPSNGDRIVEIGCLELVNRLPTGKTYHVYINPEREMPREAEAVHGLSAAFLADKPVFAEIAEEFIAFVKGAALIIHNAAFDMKFLNAELALMGRDDLRGAEIIDTLTMARKNFPAHRQASMRCVAASGLIIRAAIYTARLSTANYWPGFIWNCRAGVSPAWCFRPMAGLSRLKAHRRLMRARNRFALRVNVAKPPWRPGSVPQSAPPIRHFCKPCRNVPFGCKAKRAGPARKKSVKARA